MVPTIIKYLLDRADQEPYDFGRDERLRCFRFGRSASAPLPGVVLEQWRAVFDVPMIETFKGVIPFFISDGVRVAFILWFPILTLWLPHLIRVD